MTDRNHVVPPASFPLTETDGKPTEVMRKWMTRVTPIYYGSGSPEGVLEAPITSLYMNTAGTAGSILYIKRDQDVSGDRTQGWILV